MSKKNSHKYFVNQRHQQKLESKVYSHNSYRWSHVKFVTKEPDPKYEREHFYRFWYYEKGITLDQPKNGVYTYYSRPEVPYSIMKYPTDSRYSKLRKYFCNQANKRVRRQFKQSGKTYQYGQYKKAYEVSWNID